MSPRLPSADSISSVELKGCDIRTGTLELAYNFPPTRRHFPLHLENSPFAMRNVLAFGSLVVGTLAQTFESANFNVTEALLDNGINISAIPVLAPYSERSLFAGCSAAVSLLSR